MVRQVYRDLIDVDEATAFHTAKRLHEQLTGSIDPGQVRRLLPPPLACSSPSLTRVTAEEAADQVRCSIIG